MDKAQLSDMTEPEYYNPTMYLRWFPSDDETPTPGRGWVLKQLWMSADEKWCEWRTVPTYQKVDSNDTDA